MATLDAPRPFDALAARVAGAAAALPERERLALVMREREGAGYEAIAAALELDVSDVPDLLVTARLAVREAVRSGGPGTWRTASRTARRALTSSVGTSATSASSAAAIAS